tara:strand:+ start:3274 stop:4074 length:801 start_codon:yes stop_codon:yes gene_type:complete
MKKLILSALLLLSVCLSAQITDNKIITDRPNQTESPNTVPKGTIQIESGLLFERSEITSGLSQHRNAFPTNLFRIGIAKKLELRVINELVSYNTINNSTQEEIGKVTGTENLQIGLKYQITNDDAAIVVGLMLEGRVPTGSRGISNRLYGVVSRLSLAYNLPENKSLGANLGYNNVNLDFNDEGLVRYGQGNLTYTLVYGVSISDRVGLYVEAFGDYVEFKDWENNMDAGMTYLISDNIQLDYSYGWGLNRVMNYHAVGISIILPK